MSLATAITDVSVATIQGSLPAPVVFGDWIMRHREYAVVRVTHGLRTRRLGVHAHPRWHGRRADPQDDRPRVRRAGSSRPSSACSASRRAAASPPMLVGIGLRALSIVDLAIWDVAAKLADTSIAGAARRTQRTDAGDCDHRLPARPDGSRGDRQADRRAVRGRLAPLQGAGGGDRRAVGRSSAGSAERTPPTRGSAATPRGSTTTSNRPSSSSSRSTTSGWVGSRTSSHPATPVSSAGCGTECLCRSRWATSRAAATTRRRCCWPTPSTSCASTSPAWAGSPAAREVIDRCRRRRRAVRPAHVRPRPQPGVLGARLRGRAHRVGRAVDRGRSLRRQPRPAGDHRRDDGAAP